jgi:hypothetical protein
MCAILKSEKLIEPIEKKKSPKGAILRMNEPIKKKKRGGYRPGSGAKPKYGCKTVTMRVPADMVDDIKAFIYKKKHIEPKQEPEPQLEGQMTFDDI